MVRRCESLLSALLLAASTTWTVGAHAGDTKVKIQGPDEVALSQTHGVTLEVQDGPGPDGTPLVFTTNVGHVEPIDASHLAYTASSKHAPQVAVIAAYDPQAQAPVVHFVRLIGSPTIEVKSEPNVNVTVQVGKESFGPQRTNSAGLAQFAVQVPPGVDSATTTATDSHGNVTKGELPLNPPPYQRILALCASAESALYVVEVTPHGQPASKPSFKVQAGALTAATPTRVSDGVFRVALSTTTPTTEVLQAEVRANADGFSSACALEIAPPPTSLPYTLVGKVVPLDPPYPWFAGLNLGWLTNTNRISGPLVSARFGYSPAARHAGLRLEGELGFSQSHDELLTTDNQSLELAVQTWPLFVTGRYVLDLGPVAPMAAINLGAALSRAKASGGNVLTDESFLTPWFGAALGGMWWRGHHEVTAEASYAYANHGSGAVQGNVAGLRFTLGYNYAL